MPSTWSWVAAEGKSVAKPLFYGWILLGALWCVFAFNLGFPAYGGPLINSAMAIELNFSRETLGLITSFYIIMSGLPGPLVAMAVNRWHRGCAITVRRSAVPPTRSRCGYCSPPW